MTRYRNLEPNVRFSNGPRSLLHLKSIHSNSIRPGSYSRSFHRPRSHSSIKPKSRHCASELTARSDRCRNRLPVYHFPPTQHQVVRACHELKWYPHRSLRSELFWPSVHDCDCDKRSLAWRNWFVPSFPRYPDRMATIETLTRAVYGRALLSIAESIAFGDCLRRG